jgi:hypothetical protein
VTLRRPRCRRRRKQGSLHLELFFPRASSLIRLSEAQNTCHHATAGLKLTEQLHNHSIY